MSCAFTLLGHVAGAVHELCSALFGHVVGVGKRPCHERFIVTSRCEPGHVTYSAPSGHVVGRAVTCGALLYHLVGPWAVSLSC